MTQTTPPRGGVARTTRRGPRPLALHVALAEWAWRTGSPTTLAEFFRGVRAYRNHPYRRAGASATVVWRRDESRLRDYGEDESWPLLVVPSLVNRAYVLDLMPDASLLRYLGDHGIRPFLLEWGPAGRRMTLDDHIVDRLEPCFDWLRRTTGRRPLVMGYCMGGLLALALASRRPTDLAGLALLATPWDFHQGQGPADRLSAQRHLLAALAGMAGGASVDLLQTLFASIDPMAVPRKFARFGALDPASTAALRFVAIEDWLNDGVPLGADLTGHCILDWYGDNLPARGLWQIAGRPVRPQTLDIPAYVAIPARDRIVPAESALALAAELPLAEVIRPASGHVGMVVGARAARELWDPLLAWLRRIAATQKKPC